MDLKDFVKNTLVEIVEGVTAAQKHVGQTANINPQGVGFTRDSQWNFSEGAPPQTVEFDVALTDSHGGSTEGGIGVFLGTLGLGSKGRSDQERVSLTRIRFTVPLILPPGRKVK